MNKSQGDKNNYFKHVFFAECLYKNLKQNFKITNTFLPPYARKFYTKSIFSLLNVRKMENINSLSAPTWCNG